MLLSTLGRSANTITRQILSTFSDRRKSMVEQTAASASQKLQTSEEVSSCYPLDKKRSPRCKARLQEEEYSTPRLKILRIDQHYHFSGTVSSRSCSCGTQHPSSTYHVEFVAQNLVTKSFLPSNLLFYAEPDRSSQVKRATRETWPVQGDVSTYLHTIGSGSHRVWYFWDYCSGCIIHEFIYWRGVHDIFQTRWKVVLIRSHPVEILTSLPKLVPLFVETSETTPSQTVGKHSGTFLARIFTQIFTVPPRGNSYDSFCSRSTIDERVLQKLGKEPPINDPLWDDGHLLRRPFGVYIVNVLALLIMLVKQMAIL